MTVLKEGNIVSVKFKGGVFVTEDPAISEAIQNHPSFGRFIFMVGGKSEIPQVEPVPDVKPKSKPKGKKLSKKLEEKGIKDFMESVND